MTFSGNMGTRREPEVNGGIELKSVDGKGEEAVSLKGNTYAPEGWRDWLVAFSAFLLKFVVTGMGDSLRVILKASHAKAILSTSQLKILHYTFLYLMLAMGPFASALAEKFGFRRTVMCGSVLATVGMILSLATSADFYALLFGFSIFGGIGAGIMSTLSIVTVGLHFDKNRPIAIGVATAGSFLRHTWLTPIPKLIADSGVWQGALWWSVGLCALSTLIPLLFSQRPERSQQSIETRNLEETSVLEQLRVLLTSPSYIIFFISCFLTITGYYMSVGQHSTPTSFKAAIEPALFNKILNVTWLIAFAGAALLANQVGNYILIWNVMLTICAIALGLSHASYGLWSAIEFIVANGLYSGIYMALRPIIVLKIAKGRTLNMGYGVAQIPLLMAMVVYQISNETGLMARGMVDILAYIGVGLLLLAAVMNYPLTRILIWEEKRHKRIGSNRSWDSSQTSLQTGL